MKSTLLTLTVLMGLSLGCSSSGVKNSDPSDSREELNEVSDKSVGDWSERKNIFITQSRERVKALSLDVAELEKSKNKLNKNQKNKAQKALDETRGLLKDVREELNDLKKVDADNWEEERLEFLSKLNQLEERFVNAKSLIR